MILLCEGLLFLFLWGRGNFFIKAFHSLALSESHSISSQMLHPIDCATILYTSLVVVGRSLLVIFDC